LPAQAAGSFATGSSLPQALIQRRQRLTYYRASTEQTGHPVVVSTAACGGRLGGGPAHDGGFHLPRLRPGTDRRYAITPQPVELIASAQKSRVPSSAGVCANLPAPRSPAPSVSVSVLKTDSKFLIGPTTKQRQREQVGRDRLRLCCRLLVEVRHRAINDGRRYYHRLYYHAAQ